MDSIKQTKKQTKSDLRIKEVLKGSIKGKYNSMKKNEGERESSSQFYTWNI